MPFLIVGLIIRPPASTIISPLNYTLPILPKQSKGGKPMQLVIAEKPSVAQNLAAAVP